MTEVKDHALAVSKSMLLLFINVILSISLSQINTILSTLLLIISIVFTGYRLYNEYKTSKKNGST